jgi:integrase
MASLSQDPASKVYRIHYRYGGKQHQKSLKTTVARDAESLKGRIEETLQAIERGYVSFPPNADPWQFLLSGGKREAKLAVSVAFTLKDLFDRYEKETPPGTLEPNSWATEKLHRKHLLRILGEKQQARTLTVSELQDYVNARGREKQRGEPIKPRTIQKEVATFRKLWNWGVRNSLVPAPAPVHGLLYGKDEEPLPFMTWGEIERRIGRGGLDEKQIKGLWECLFLNVQQTQGLLAHVKTRRAFPFVYPMFVFVAHTGARRSEMMRSQVEDFDFETGQVKVWEKKKNQKKKFTCRYVPMTDLLREVMKEWFAKGHPGGPHSFCHGDLVPRSNKRGRTTGHKGEKTRASSLKGRLAEVRERTERRGPEPLTPKEADDAFTQPLTGSKWEVVAGFHVLRHSFASNLAARGVRPEVIDEYMGHKTLDQRRRYGHLFPKEKQDGLRKVFG